MDQVNDRPQNVRPANVHRSRSNQSESGNSEIPKNSCPICFNELLDVAAYQACGHVLCFDCAVRNRVLCDKKECPVCRSESGQVVLAGHVSHSAQDEGDRFRSILAAGKNRGDEFYGFIFENIGIERAYRKILTHACRSCDRKFDNFDELVRHCRERHEQHYCTVCVRSLMLFTWEHKLYYYDELLRHMEEGDPADKNIPPHPACQLCHFRAFDKDDLFKHSKHRHHLCWICERSFNKLLFFGSFIDLADHMSDHHHVCKRCSNPDEARLTAFPDQNGLEIHTAADHSDGSIRPEMLFNLQPRNDRGGQRASGGGRQNRNHADKEDEENIRPPSPPSQLFNMDAAQFPALSAAETGGPSVASGQNHGSGYSSAGRNLPGNQNDSSSELTNNLPRYAPPRLNQDNFPALGDGAPGSSKSGNGIKGKKEAGSSWGSGPKISAAPASFSKKITVDPPQRSSSAKFTVQEDSFPALSVPSSSAAAKVNREWTSVPVKTKSKASGNKSSTAVISNPSKASSLNRWDVLETVHETTPSPVKSPTRQPEVVSRSEDVTKHENRFVRHQPDLEAVDAESFPSLTAPSKKALPVWFSTGTQKSSKSAPKPSTPKKKVETANTVLARSLFHAQKGGQSMMDDDDDSKDEHVMPVALPPPVIHARPFSMKKDEFPSLAGVKGKVPMKPANEPAKVDRIRKQKEVKSQWGNAVVQYETVFQYIPPPSAEDRANQLRAKLEPVEVKGKLKTLDDFQKELLDQVISPLEFWMECRRLLGKKFAQLMPEVLLLLPSLDLQAEVFEVAKVPIYGDPTVVKNLSQCSVCRQTVRNGDEKTYHSKFHKN